MNASLHLSLRPRWEEIDAARDEAVSFLREQDFGEAALHAAGMIVCELAENATKYGAFDEAMQQIQIAIRPKATSLTIEVRSPVESPDDEHLKRLDKTVQWIRGFEDPFDAYRARLQALSSQSVEQGESGLGLVRIAYEGQSALEFFLSEPNVLAVSAVHSKGGTSCLS